jgi:hypothetical protein
MRIFDTRDGNSPNALRTVAKQQVSGGYGLQVQMTGPAGFVPQAGVGAMPLTGTVYFSTFVRTDLVVDINGWFATSADWATVTGLSQDYPFDAAKNVFAR